MTTDPAPIKSASNSSSACGSALSAASSRSKNTRNDEDSDMLDDNSGASVPSFMSAAEKLRIDDQKKGINRQSSGGNNGNGNNNNSRRTLGSRRMTPLQPSEPTGKRAREDDQGKRFFFSSS